MTGPHRRTLRRAVEILGGPDRVAQALGVSPSDVEAYLSGLKPLPDRLFLRALDIVAGRKIGGENHGKG